MSCCTFKYDICLPQHDDREFRFQVVDGSGVLVDVAEVTDLVWEIATGNTAATPLLVKSIAAGDITTVNPSTWTVTISSTESAGLLTAQYHEMRMESLSGEFSTVMTGRFRCLNTIIGD